MKPALRALWAGERKPSSGSLSSLMRHHLKRRSQLIHSLAPTPFFLKFQRAVLWKFRRENLLISHDKKPSGNSGGTSRSLQRATSALDCCSVRRAWGGQALGPLVLGPPPRLDLLTLADYPCSCPKKGAGAGWEVREAAGGQSVPGPRPSCCSSGSTG